MATNDKPKKEEDDSKPYTHYEQVVTRRVQHYYLSSAIESPEQYVDMIHKIQTAGADEVIYVHLNTPGGQLDTGAQIINAMHSSQAHIIVSIEANCHSLGTLIFLAADEFVVHNNCLMMIHNYSSGIWGKGNEQQSMLDGQMKWFNTMAKKLYIPFLSAAEYDRVIRGEDLWLQSEDIRKRLEKMVKPKKSSKKGKKNVDRD